MTDNYFQWSDPTCVDDDREWSVDFPVWAWGTEWTMQEGLAVTNWDPSLIALYSPHGVPTDFCTEAEWHVYSGRLKSLVERAAPGAVQYLPFRLCSSVGSDEIPDYWVANHLRLIDCLDRNRTTSDWEPMELGDYAIHHAVLSRSLIGSDVLFRVKGNSGLVVVREDLKFRIETAGMTGCVFRPVEVSR